MGACASHRPAGPASLHSPLGFWGRPGVQAPEPAASTAQQRAQVQASPGCAAIAGQQRQAAARGRAWQCAAAAPCPHHAPPAPRSPGLGSAVAARSAAQQPRGGREPRLSLGWRAVAAPTRRVPLHASAPARQLHLLPGRLVPCCQVSLVLQLPDFRLQAPGVQLVRSCGRLHQQHHTTGVAASSTAGAEVASHTQPTQRPRLLPPHASGPCCLQSWLRESHRPAPLPSRAPAAATSSV